MTESRRARWRRFRLRTMLALVTACCLMLGIWSVYVDPYRKQASSVAAVNRLHGQIFSTPASGPIWQQWLVTTMLGPDAFTHVHSVDLAGRKVDDQDLTSLSDLIDLRELNLDRTQITDGGMKTLEPLRRLQTLSLRFTAVSDQAMSHLAEMPELDVLYLTSTEVSDAAVFELAKLGNLDELFVRWTLISSAGARQLREALPACAVHHHPRAAAAAVTESTASQ